ncbi:uncharacterized protein EKO05_0009458 [Ascochyta rabiei]|uniref:uncharacterized protein n=1 Tax=Didymella rabiei TaxID=5454 RepID=UPI002206BDDD|nr:uncharacterized protein EKO05_0009458 [Ascochyta rabiei]UPX19189.1 hypothetical protein EKO05_0009458 [Ascochyta rabiei]
MAKPYTLLMVDDAEYQSSLSKSPSHHRFSLHHYYHLDRGDCRGTARDYMTIAVQSRACLTKTQIANVLRPVLIGLYTKARLHKQTDTIVLTTTAVDEKTDLYPHLFTIAASPSLVAGHIPTDHYYVTTRSPYTSYLTTTSIPRGLEHRNALSCGPLSLSAKSITWRPKDSRNPKKQTVWPKVPNRAPQGSCTTLTARPTKQLWLHSADLLPV